MKTPRVKVDVRKIRENAESVVRECERHGIDVVGVTKGVAGMPEVAQAMLAGGVKEIADSRIKNIKKLKQAGIRAPIMLLRPPQKHEIPETIRLADASIETELSTIKELSREAGKTGCDHSILLMIEMGDLREGIIVSDWCRYVERIEEIKNIDLKGIGVNFMCASGVVPTTDKMAVFADTVDKIERHIGRKLSVVSGGSSANLSLLFSEGLPDRVNQLRVGESILLGSDPVTGQLFDGFHQDAFILEAEVIEIKRKPSSPMGKRGMNAFKEKPELPDKGARQRAILAIGKQEIPYNNVKPLMEESTIESASSDHMMLDVTGKNVEVGDHVSFSLDYSSLMHLMTSQYVYNHPMTAPKPDEDEESSSSYYPLEVIS